MGYGYGRTIGNERARPAASWHNVGQGDFVANTEEEHNMDIVRMRIRQIEKSAP